MWRAVLRHAKSWLSRKRQRPAPVVPMWLQARRTSLSIIANNGGPGSDIAAAEARGITTTIMALGR